MLHKPPVQKQMLTQVLARSHVLQSWEQLQLRSGQNESLETFGGKGGATLKFRSSMGSCGLGPGGEGHSEFTRDQSVTNVLRLPVRVSALSTDKCRPIPTALSGSEDPPTASEPDSAVP